MPTDTVRARAACKVALRALAWRLGFFGVLLHSLAAHAGLTPHVRDVRGWAVAGPLLIVAAVVSVARSHH